MKRTALLLAAAAAVCACASQPASPFFGDDRYLVLGVDPNAEADTLAEQLEQSGYLVERTLRGQHFSALGATRPDGQPGKVRVLTVRGIALALDSTPGDPLQPAVHYALLAPPSRESHDADGDGFEEVFVATATGAGSACILVYRVRDSGFVDLVAESFALPPQRTTDAPWQAPDFCEHEPPEDAEHPEQSAPEAPEPAEDAEVGASAGP